jgi:hypothetical protein
LHQQKSHFRKQFCEANQLVTQLIFVILIFAMNIVGRKLWDKMYHVTICSQKYFVAKNSGNRFWSRVGEGQIAISFHELLHLKIIVKNETENFVWSTKGEKLKPR